MDDTEFVQRIKQRIEGATGTIIELSIDADKRSGISVDLSSPTPRVTFGADAIKYSGLARMFTQYTILCLKEKRKVSDEEFIHYLRRN